MAGKQAGLLLKTPPPDRKKALDAVAQNDAAQAIRDDLWSELEERFRDRTYTLDAIHRWLVAQGCSVGRSSLDRARRPVLAEIERFRHAAAKSKAAVEAAADGGDDVFRAGRLAAAQLAFEALLDIDPDALASLEVKQILKLMEVHAKLSTAHAKADIMTAKLEEMQRNFDEQMAAAQAKAASGDGTITEEMIVEAREAIFGKVA